MNQDHQLPLPLVNHGVPFAYSLAIYEYQEILLQDKSVTVVLLQWLG